MKSITKARYLEDTIDIASLYKENSKQRAIYDKAIINNSPPLNAFSVREIKGIDILAIKQNPTYPNKKDGVLFVPLIGQLSKRLAKSMLEGSINFSRSSQPSTKIAGNSSYEIITLLSIRTKITVR